MPLSKEGKLQAIVKKAEKDSRDSCGGQTAPKIKKQSGPSAVQQIEELSQKMLLHDSGLRIEAARARS